MSDQPILSQRQNGIATLTLNRPDRLNAWTAEMGQLLRERIEAASADEDIRCIVITGSGRGFCAGADMQGLGETADTGGSQRAEGKKETVTFENAPGPEVGEDYPGHFGYFFSCPKPIIAAINGPCAGIGLVLTLYADLRFANQDAKLTTAFAARGLIAEHGIAWLLPRLVGEANALDLLLSARKFTGAEAAELGLVNKALPNDELMGHVATVAEQLAQFSSPRSMAIMKRQVRASYLQNFSDSLKEANREMHQSFSAPDFKEGVCSYVEGRAPEFAGITAQLKISE